MKHLKLIIIPVVATIFAITISCERDDICPESSPTTPSLIIDLLDFENSENLKNAPRLLVIGTIEGNKVALPGYEGNSQQSSLILPLKTDEDSTSFELVQNAEFDSENNLIGGNIDLINITYTREEIYVSRACGYKTIFKDVIIDIVDDSSNWLLGEPEDLTNNEPVENENATHFNLFH